MLDIPVSWQFRYEDSRNQFLCSFDHHQPVEFRITQTRMHAEWALCCGWPRISTPGMPPIFIEIHRESSAGEVLISGNFILSDRSHENCFLVKKKFVRLIESDHLSIRLRLQYSQCNHGRLISNSFALNGHIYVFDRSKRYLIDLSDIGSSKAIPREYSIDKLDPVLSFPEVNAKYGTVKCLMQLSNDFLRFKDQGETSSCDVNLKCGTVSLPAHKHVLSARSPVFSAMFRCDMKEGQENEVDVPDINESALQTLLIYVYSGRTCKLNESLAADLLFAADKYQLDGLKAVCCSYLKSHMSVANAVNVLVLGELHDRDLKTSALTFMSTKCEEFSDLEKTEEWSKLLKERPSLAIEVLTSVVKFQEVKHKKMKIS